jgi:hypothetical protein
VGPHAKFEILAAHSGGGALILSAITLETTPTLRAILPEVRTIALLDANYAFEHETHGQHLARWLASDNSRCLVVLAYDDREILVNGRKIVGPTGGTLRANLRMTDSLTSLGVELDTDSDGISTRTVGLAGRVRLETLANPHNQILHTVLVERNGLIHALTPGGHKLFMESPAYRSKIRSLIPQARAPE